MFSDFEDFKSEVSFFIKQNDKIDVTTGELTVNKDFEKIFPSLNKLMNKARILNVKINSLDYKLYSWTTSDGGSCGWLCKIEPENVSQIEILPEHQLLLDSIGGIKESYNEPYSFTNNQNFLFTKSKCHRGAEYWTEYYEEMCEEEKVTPMNVENLTSFADEANGGKTLYDLNTKQVYLFSHDHAFDYVTFMPGQPEYTFHYINGVNNFVDYVETLSKQWEEHIES